MNKDGDTKQATHDTYQSVMTNIKRFRWRSLASFAFVGFIAITMIIHISNALDHTISEQINIAGKQRMLSQKILTDTYAIYGAVNTEQWEELEPALRDLNESIHSLVESHNYLISQQFALQNEPIQSGFLDLQPSFDQLVDQSAELNKLTLNVIRRAPYIDHQSKIRIDATKKDIQEAQSEFLPQIHEIVTLYDQISTKKVKSSIVFAKRSIFLLLIILVVVTLFVIEPALLLIRKQLHDLRIAREKAVQAEAVRWRLLTNIGHEFRTPMNAIMGFADLLKDDQVSSDEQKRLVQSIYSSSTELTSLIESMLDMSAIEAGQLKVASERCDLHSILNETKDQYSPTAVSKSLNINLMINENCPRFITSDAKRLKQVFANITDNAIKFTEKGFVNIQAKLINKDTKPLIEVQIKDTGIGINEEDLQSIFNPFVQAEDSLTRDFGGAGLGLSTSKDIALALGGDLRAQSQLAVGSTFTITFDPGAFEMAAKDEPAPVIEPDKTAEPALPFENKKILIVDDAKDNRMLLKHILKKTGAQLEFAVDGKAAVESVEMAIETDAPFDIVLMDMQMPVMDGYTATVTLRDRDIKIPIIAVTAHALEGDRQHCLDAGCDDYLSKPVKKKLLIETITQLLNEHETSLNHASESTSDPDLTVPKAA